MVRSLQHILTVSALAAASFVGSKCAYAQEVTGSNYDWYNTDSDRERERDRVVLTAGESTDPTTTHKSISTNVTTKDSVSAIRVPATQRTTRSHSTQSTESSKTAAKPKGEDDSILNFNFLYYIIQKYKLQDIVD